MTLRLIIPTTPSFRDYDHENSYVPLAHPRYRSRETFSSISNPEYQAACFDRLEITIPLSPHKSSNHQTRSGILITSKSTPNLRKPLENIPEPPPPPIPSTRDSFTRRQAQSHHDRPEWYSPRSNSSSSIDSDFSPVTPRDDQLFFLPSFTEQETGLAIEFEPLGAPSPEDHVPRPSEHTTSSLSSHPMVYELEDTSKSRLQSPTDPLSPISLLEKPLPLIPCSRSLEKKINATKSHASSRRRKQTLGRTEPEPWERSLNYGGNGSHKNLGGTVGSESSKANPSKSSSQPAQSHTVSAGIKDLRPVTSGNVSKGSSKTVQTQSFQHLMDGKTHGQMKKKNQKPFSIHLGRLHLVFGSTKAELAESRRNVKMYSDSHDTNNSFCQDSQGRIQHL